MSANFFLLLMLFAFLGTIISGVMGLMVLVAMVTKCTNITPRKLAPFYLIAIFTGIIFVVLVLMPPTAVR